MMVVFLKPPSQVNRRVSLTEGPFFVGTLWVLKLIYGNFLRYLLTIPAVDSFFIYIVINWLYVPIQSRKKSNVWGCVLRRLFV